MRRTWEEIIELVLHKVLTPSMCRAIMRVSGFRAGGDAEVDPEDIDPWFPGGGYPGDFFNRASSGQFFARWRWETPQWIVSKLKLKAIRDEPDYYIGKEIPIGTHTVGNPISGGGEQSSMDYSGPGEQGDLPGTPAFGGIGDGKPTMGDVPHHFYRLELRNARHAAGPNPYPSVQPQPVPPFNTYRAQPQPDQRFHEEIWAGERRKELLRWDNIPVGTWHFPYNVDWFVTKRDLSARYNQNRRRQMKLRTGWVKGNPPADLHLRYSTNGGASWQDLMSVNLQPGGIRNTGWVPFPEGAAADVLLGSFITVRSPISRLDMSQVDAFMRWEPIDPKDLVAYDEFGTSHHQPRGVQTLSFGLAAPGRLVPANGRYYFADYKMAPESEQYYPFSTSNFSPPTKAEAIRSFYWDRGPGSGLGGSPGWTAIWLVQRNRPTAKVTVQMVQTLGGPPDNDVAILPEGDGVRVQLAWDYINSTSPSQNHQDGRLAHIHGHVWFGAEHSGDGIMRPDSERGLTSNNYNQKGIGRCNENDVYSAYRWLWG